MERFNIKKIRILVTFIISIVILYIFFMASFFYIVNQYVVQNKFHYQTPENLLRINNKKIITETFYINNYNLSSINLFLINNSTSNFNRNITNTIKVVVKSHNKDFCSQIIPIIYIKTNSLNSINCGLKNKQLYTIEIMGENIIKTENIDIAVVKSNSNIIYNRKKIKGGILMGFTYNLGAFNLKNIKNSWYVLKRYMSEYKPGFMTNFYIYIFFGIYFIFIPLLIIFIICKYYSDIKIQKQDVLKVIILITILIILYLFLHTHSYNQATFA